MIILLCALVIILIIYTLLNYNRETFIVLYDNINEYLKQNVDYNVLKDSNCFDNDRLLSEIKSDPLKTCANHYPLVGDIHYKVKVNDDGTLPEAVNSDDEHNYFYDKKTGNSYSFAELCPITTNQLSSTLCLRRHNNEISDVLFRLNGIVKDTELKHANSLTDVDITIDDYRNDRYRLFNDPHIQDYMNNN